MLSHYLAAPCQGHLEQWFHIFSYLKRYNKLLLVFDAQEPTFDESRFQKVDWLEYYPGAMEQVPPNAPELRGKSLTMSCFVDADLAGCHATCRSHTGVLIYLNCAPIVWYSKRQNTVESSTFGSEFIAMKTAIDLIKGLRYKLRMMGIKVDGPTNLFCNNKAVVINSTKPESTLKKKHNDIAYHRVQEALVAEIARVAKEDGATNLSNGLTKCLPGPRLRAIFGAIWWWRPNVSKMVTYPYFDVNVRPASADWLDHIPLINLYTCIVYQLRGLNNPTMPVLKYVICVFSICSPLRG